MSRIISLVTLYNPDEAVADHLRRIQEQSDFTVVCDNSRNDNSKIISGLSGDSIIYVPNYNNLGLSCAFNSVLKDDTYIKWNQDDLVFFFDQDSVIAPDHIKGIVGEYHALIKKGVNVGCIGPAYYDTSMNGELRVPNMHQDIDSTNMSVSCIMTSSMMIRYSVLQEVDFWNQDIFLDMADWDICWRIRRKGYCCIMTKISHLVHSVGLGFKKVGVIRLKVTTPIREYYQTRDCLFLLKYSYVPLKFKIRFLLQVTVRPFAHIVFLKDKKQRAYYIFRGMIDYFRGSKGEFRAEG